MLRAATSTFRMSLNPTREQMTRGHGKRLLGRVDGSLEARHFKNFIAPRLVDFSAWRIHEITGIEKNALRGDALSNFNIKEGRSWVEHRMTMIEEDVVYCLIGIFDVLMVPNYGERKDQVLRRLEEDIHMLYKGVDFEQFAIGLSLASFPEATQFVAR